MTSLALRVAVVLLTSACSSIIEGTSQSIALNTNPPGADCSLNREGLVIGRINPTPGSVVVEKTKHDILIRCNKEGYQEATYHNNSGAAGATFGNIVLGGPIGWAIDSASGADNKYGSPVNLTMVPSATASSPLSGIQDSTSSAPTQPVPSSGAISSTADQAAPGTCTWNAQEYHYDCW